MKCKSPLTQNTRQGIDTFCIRPWKHLEVRRDGKLDFCCKFRTPLHTSDGTPLVVTQHSLDEIWNCDELRGIRRNMIKGQYVKGCEVCYERELAGYPSDRLSTTLGWHDGWLNEERRTFDQLKARSVADNYQVLGPAYIQISAGNLCNLKCRTCYGCTSSSITHDPVHSQWSGSHIYSKQERWWQNQSVLDKIFQYPQLVRRLHLIGGEPFLVKELRDVLQYLIDRGVAQNIVLEMATNGTVKRAPWLPLIKQFKRLELFLSIDGYNQLNHYIRYPCRWDHLVKNIQCFKTLPNTVLSTMVVLQAYNALNLVDLFRFFDSVGLPLGYVFPIDHPPFLRTHVLPPKVRRLAAQRLRVYVDQDCRLENRQIVTSLANGLEAQGNIVDEDRLVEFMLFTNDLDVSRKQSFQEACPELHELIRQSGYKWTSATLWKSYQELQLQHTSLRALVRELVRQGWQRIRRKPVSSG